MLGNSLCKSPRGYQSLQREQHIERHRHPHSYAAIVVSGDYLEAGDSGRCFVRAGFVVFHRAWEAHLDRVGPHGSRILNIALADLGEIPSFGQLTDPDEIVRLAERDASEAARRLLEQVRPAASSMLDWPDMLALSIRADPSMSIHEWTAQRRLSASTVSRGFRAAYGVSPKRFRLEVRTTLALAHLQATNASMSAVAALTGFADQAHMTRAVAMLTGYTPKRLRVSAKSVQDSARGELQC